MTEIVKASARIDDIHWATPHYIWALDGAASVGYLLQERALARRWAEMILPAVNTFYFGAWRESVSTGQSRERPPNAAYWRTHAQWMDVFRIALFWGAALDDWTAIVRVAEYPDDDVGLDSHKRPSTRRFLLDLAAHVRGETVEGCAERVASEVGPTFDGIDCLARALDGIRCRDSVAVSQGIYDALASHLRRVPWRRGAIYALHREASFLVRWARRCGLSVAVDSDHEQFILQVAL